MIISTLELEGADFISRKSGEDSNLSYSTFKGLVPAK
jgi:hypothetical protein